MENTDSIYTYDAFLSHNSWDKPIVTEIAEKLKHEEKLNVFLDQWHLIPGDPWQEGLEKALDESALLRGLPGGQAGLGPWQKRRDALGAGTTGHLVGPFAWCRFFFREWCALKRRLRYPVSSEVLHG